MAVDQSKDQLYQQIWPILQSGGPTITRDALAKMRPQLNAIGVKIQNEDRGDFRPRLYLPDKRTVDLGDFDGPWQWVDRGDMSGGGDNTFGAGGGIQQYKSPLDELRNTPGYQFEQQEGMNAVQRSAASKGTLLTGGTMKALLQYSQGLADRTYGDAFQRWLQMAKLGQTTAPPPV